MVRHVRKNKGYFVYMHVFENEVLSATGSLLSFAWQTQQTKTENNLL